jgi:hypothetical protein
MFKDTEEMLSRGQSWNGNGRLPDTEATLRWKAWLRASKKEYTLGNMKKTPAAVLGSRWERGLPGSVRCERGYCPVTRKGHVLATLQSRRGLVVCKDCEDPSSEGSFIDIWPCHYQMTDYHIDAEIVYSVPNDGQGGRIVNAEHLHDNIALVDRGRTPIVDIVRTVETTTDALAVIIADDGQCGPNFACPRGSRAPGEGFGAADDWQRWVGLNTPCFLIHKRDGERLKAMMPLEKVDLGRFGEQLVCSEDH